MSKHLSPRAERPALWRRVGSVRLRAFFALGVVGVLGATGTTFAAWTDSATVAGATLTAGRIDLKVNDQDAVTGYTSLTLSAMVPGSSVAAVVTVKNAGAAPLKYTAATTATNADGKGLRDQVAVKVTGATAVTGTAPAATCGGATYYSATALGTALTGAGRQLAVGGSEQLCVQLTLSSTAPSSVQGGTTDLVLSLTATTDLA